MNALAIKARKDSRGGRPVEAFIVETDPDLHFSSSFLRIGISPQGKPIKMDVHVFVVKRECA
jgi:hypothetical protein